MRFLRRGVICSGFAWKSLLWHHGKEGGETGGWKITWKDSAFIQCHVLGIISGCFPKIPVGVHGVREGLTLWRVRREEKNHTMKPCLYLHKDLTSIGKVFSPHLPASAALRVPAVSSVRSLSHVWPFGTHGLQHARLPSPSQAPRACSNSCPKDI